MICRMCYADLKKKWLFCPYCGLKIVPGKKEEDIRQTLTFQELYDRWAESYQARVSSSTMYCYKAARKYFSALDDRPFYTLDLEDLQSSVDDCPRGKRTRENMKALACLLYRYALPRHISDQNYALFVDTGLGRSEPRSAFTTQEINMILSHVGRTQYADEIAVLIYTGFRPCELVELKGEQFIQEEEISYLIGGRKTVAGINRVVTIAPKVLPIIQRRAEGNSGLLFLGRMGKRCLCDISGRSISIPLWRLWNSSLCHKKENLLALRPIPAVIPSQT